jgi:elongation factor 1-gamma
VEPVFTSLIIPVLGYYPVDVQSSCRAHQELMIRLHVLDKHLKASNFMVGTHLTIADVQMASLITLAFRFIIDETIRKNLPNLTRWFNHVSHLPAFLNHFGRPRNCKTAFPAL